MPRLTVAHVTSMLALVVALGGTGYAAGVLPRNSVGTAQLKAGGVTSAKVKDRSLLAKDFKPGQLPRGARGPAGPAGPAGPFTGDLPSGETLRGVFYAGADARAPGTVVTDNVSWGLTVDPTPEVRLVQVGGAPTAECPGTTARPEAAPGFACFYVRVADNVGNLINFSPESPAGTYRLGAALYGYTGASGLAQSVGTWAVTAP